MKYPMKILMKFNVICNKNSDDICDSISYVVVNEISNMCNEISNENINKIYNDICNTNSTNICDEISNEIGNEIFNENINALYDKVCNKKFL